MKKTIITIAVAGVVTLFGGLLFGLDPVETFKFIVSLFGA